MTALRVTWRNRIPDFTDLCGYFFEKARAQIELGRSERAGLLATNSIRGGANRQILDRIVTSGQIFYAWSDEPWILDGAAVRISIVAFDDGTEKNIQLNGEPVARINPDLTGSVDITVARRLDENKSLGFIGIQTLGKFDLDAVTAQTWNDVLPEFATHHPSDVLRPYLNAADIVRRNRNRFIVDFGLSMSETDAAMYGAPYDYVRENVYPMRQNRPEPLAREKWWLHWRARPDLLNVSKGMSRLIATPIVSKHRVFAWITPDVLASHAVAVFAREDDYFFGVLHSRAHELWSLRMGTSLEDRPRYTPTTTFETYPFPWPPGQEPVDDSRVIAIGDAAKALDDARNAWLNPEGASESELKKRTLTNLYNANPTWLKNFHANLDRAVWDAYGWPADEVPAEVEEDVVLARLLELNLERSGNG